MYGYLLLPYISNTFIYTYYLYYIVMQQTIYKIKQEIENRFSSISTSDNKIWCIRANSAKDALHIVNVLSSVGVKGFYVDIELNFIYFGVEQ